MERDIQLPADYYQSRQELAFALLGADVVQISDDSRLVLDVSKMTDPLYKLAARCMMHLRKGRIPCDAVYGHDKIDIALADKFSFATGVKRVDLDFQTFGHRCSVMVRRYSGPQAVSKVLIVRHQARTGLAIRKMVSEIRQTGVETGNVIVLFDWQDDDVAKVLDKQNIELHAVFTVDELLDIFVDAGWLSKYRRATIGWQTAYA